MAANWGSIASQLASMGLTHLAREAVSHGAEAEARQREELRRRTEAEERERAAQEAAKRPSPTAAMAALQMQLRSLSPQQLESLWTELVAHLRAGAGGQVPGARALVLASLADEFEKARALPRPEERTQEMRRVISRLQTLLPPR
jgi:hypothetical protein